MFTCDICGTDLVERTGATPEQAFCGTWFDHPARMRGLCDFNSRLVPSDGLMKQMYEMEHAASEAPAVLF